MRTKVLLLIPAFWLALVGRAEAVSHGYCGMDLQGEPGFQTNERCFALEKTNDWLGRLTHEIQTRPVFDHIAATLMHEFLDYQKMECTFQVGKAGNIANLRIHDSSGSDRVDALLAKFITESAPFAASPNNISWERGIMVEFCKIPVADKVQIKVWFHLDPDTRGKNFQIEHYIDVSEERKKRCF